MAQPLAVSGVLLVSLATRPFFDRLEQSRYENHLRDAYEQIIGIEPSEELNSESLEKLAREAGINVDSLKEEYKQIRLK